MSKSRNRPFSSAKPNTQGARPSAPRSKEQRASRASSLPEGVYVVEGAAAIREYLRFKPNDVKKIFAKERQMAVIRKEFAGFDVKIESVAEKTNESDDGGLPGTPVWAHVQHSLLDWTTFEQRTLKKIRANDLVVVLDHISDPRNLGAIVRTAAFFGVKHVIVPERRQVLLTPAAVGTAQGGFALTDLVVVVNVARTLEQLKELGFWVLGAAMDGEAVDGIRGRYERQVLVLGSEDKGISSNVLSRCDVKVRISGAAHTLDSLNVSVAAGILLQRLSVLP